MMTLKEAEKTIKDLSDKVMSLEERIKKLEAVTVEDIAIALRNLGWKPRM